MCVCHAHWHAFQAPIPEFGLPFRRAGLFNLCLQKRFIGISKWMACARTQVLARRIYSKSSWLKLIFFSDFFLKHSDPSPINKRWCCTKKKKKEGGEFIVNELSQSCSEYKAARIGVPLTIIPRAGQKCQFSPSELQLYSPQCPRHVWLSNEMHPSAFSH